MSLFQRLRTTLRADAHGVVDALEDDALLLKQYLRDAEAEVERKRGRLCELATERKRLDAERENARNVLARAERDADLAVEGSRDDLARYALKQVLKLRGALERMEARLSLSAEEKKELEGTLATQEVMLEELRVRVQTFLSERDRHPDEIMAVSVTEEQVELELLRRKKEATGTATGTASKATASTVATVGMKATERTEAHGPAKESTDG